MKASKYIPIKGKAHGLRDIFARGKKIPLSEELYWLDETSQKAVRFEFLAELMLWYGLAGAALSVISFPIAFKVEPEWLAYDISGTIVILLAYITLGLFVASAITETIHRSMMRCSPETQKFVELVNIVLQQEVQKERASVLLNEVNPLSAATLSESLIALLAGDLVDAEDSRDTTYNVETARKRFHLTYEALAELGVPLEKKRTYFPVKAK